MNEEFYLEKIKTLEEFNVRLQKLAKRLSDTMCLNAVLKELSRHKNVCWLIRDKDEALFVIGQFLQNNADNISFHNNGFMKFKQGNSLVVCSDKQRIEGMTIDVTIGIPEEDYNLIKGIADETE